MFQCCGFQDSWVFRSLDLLPDPVSGPVPPAQNFALFFFLPQSFFLFFCWGSLRCNLVVVHFGLSGCRVTPQRPFFCCFLCHLVLNVLQCLVVDGFSTKICRECGSKYCVVHVLHRCSGLTISQMSTSTSSSGQGGRQPHRQSSKIRQHACAAHVRESRTPDDDAVANQAHIE